MTENDKHNKDEFRRGEVMTSLTKGILGAAPIVGSLLAEVVGQLIPNRRIERIQDVVRELDRQLKEIGAIPSRERLTDAKFGDILEDTLIQAARAVSEERARFLASVLQRAITEEDLRYTQLKALLRLLNEISDAEVTILASFSLQHMHDSAFHDKHDSVLIGPRAHTGSDQETLDEYAVYQTYRNNLERLGLLRRTFSRPKRGELPEFDEYTGLIKARGWEITGLGDLLLRCIEFERHDA